MARKGTIADYKEKLNHERDLVRFHRAERKKERVELDEVRQELATIKALADRLEDQLTFEQSRHQDQTTRVKAAAFDLMLKMMMGGA